MTSSGESDTKVTVDGYPGQIGRIDSVWIGVEDHGVLTFNLGFDFGGTHQGLGHLIIGSPSRDEYSKQTGRLLYRLTQIVGNVAEAKGREVIVLRKSDGWGASIVGIAPLMRGEALIFEDAIKDPHDT